MAQRKPSGYFAVLPAAAWRAQERCPACGEGVPYDARYCLWCGVELGAAEVFREKHEAELELHFPGLTEEMLRPILRHRRKLSRVEHARALLAHEALIAGMRNEIALRCLPQVGIQPLDYQVQTALTVLGRMHGRAVLADEVGLGKTIEAGLILKELQARNMADSVLILVPSSLVEQWKEELDEKFHVSAVTHESRHYWRRKVVLLSLTRAKQPAVARKLARRRWDLVIVDEAHSLKNARTVAHAFVRSLTAARLLLLTATPIENDLRELYNLLTLVDPTVYPTFRRFARDFLVSRFKVRDVGRLRRFCEQYMVRNRRTFAFPELPPRLPRLLPCRPSPAEGEFVLAVLEFVRRVYARLQRRADKGREGPDGAGAATMLFLSLLLKESCSSPQAVLSTVRNVVSPLLDDEDHHYLESLLAQGENVGLTGKMEAFLREIERLEGGSAVAYVEFFATHQRLMELLKKKRVRVIPFTGRMNAAEKLEHVERFRKKGGILLCTEVGGQGLNLQHCNVVINYDIPWNPMRLEQRIGRVHRFGQERPIEIVNFVTAGSYEEHVYQLLAMKLELFTQAVGEVEAILSFVEEEESVQQMVARAICTADSEELMRENFQRLSSRFEEAAARFAKSRDATSLLFDRGR